MSSVLVSARVLLIDLSSPLDEDVCQGIISSVEKSLSLVCSLVGPSRLSFFGLYALGTYPEASFSKSRLRERQRQCCDVDSNVDMTKLLRFLNETRESLQK